MDIYQKIYSTVSKIPKGKIATYSQIAKKLNIKSARLVGHALHQNPDQKSTPCHRITNVKGELAENFAFGGKKEQKRLLENEGIEFVNGKVDLKKYLWGAD